MGPCNAKFFDGFPCSRSDCDLERIAEQPTETGRPTRLHDNAFKQFFGWIFENVLQGTASEPPKKSGMIRSRSTEDHVGKGLFGIVMVASNNLIEGIRRFFRPFAAAVLMVFCIGVELPTHLVCVRPSKRPFQFVEMGLLAHTTSVALQSREARAALFANGAENSPSENHSIWAISTHRSGRQALPVCSRPNCGRSHTCYDLLMKLGYIEMSCGLRLGPATSETDLLDALAGEAQPLVSNGAYRSYLLPKTNLDGRTFTPSVYFADGTLSSIHLTWADPRIKGVSAWEDFSFDRERSIAEADAAWLAASLGGIGSATGTYTFDWGTVRSGLDERSGFSSVVIRYNQD